MRHNFESRAREALKGSESGDKNGQEDLGERRRPDSMERQDGIREKQEDKLDVEEDEFDVPSELRAQLPLSFGGGAKVRERGRPDFIANPLVNNAAGRDANQVAKNAAEMIDVEGMRTATEEPEIGPPRPPNLDDGDGDDDDDSLLLNAREDEDPWQLPVTSEAVLEPHSRAVICLAWDESGSRLLSGSNDYSIKIFDFGGMKSDCRPFRSLIPCDGHPVIALSWSPNGDAFLAVTTSNQPKVYDRDGKEQGEFPLGDMYIRDMKNTKGHIAPCRGGTWHPKDKGTGLTCSEDGTLRVWDLWTLEQKTVIKPTLLRPRRVPVTACCYSSEDGSMIAGGLQDGTLQLWDVRGKFGQSAAVGVVAQPKAQMVRKQTWTYVSRTGHLIRNGHEPETDITSLSFSKLDGGKTLLSRGSDGTVKLWDIRKFKSPITEAQNLPTGYATTGCCFSPDERLVLTGIGIEKKGDVGSLTVLDRSNLGIVRRLVMQGSVVAVTWHPRLNQIAVGCGDRKEGTARILYDSSMSIRGALMALGRRPRKENANDYRVWQCSTFLNFPCLFDCMMVWESTIAGIWNDQVEEMITGIQNACIYICVCVCVYPL